MTTTLGSIDMPLDRSRQSEGGRLGSIPTTGHLGGVSYGEVAAISVQNSRLQAGLVGDDLDEKKGIDAFNRPVISAREWFGGGGGGTAWNEMNLGYSQAGMTISYTAGYLWFGTQDEITIAGATVTLPETVQDVWIYVKHAWGSIAAEILSDITSLTTPASPIDDTDYMRWPLTQWRVTSTGVAPDVVWSAARHSFSHVGDIVVKTVRGA